MVQAFNRPLFMRGRLCAEMQLARPQEDLSTVALVNFIPEASLELKGLPIPKGHHATMNHPKSEALVRSASCQSSFSIQIQR
jgi:hypothetical protein